MVWPYPGYRAGLSHSQHGRQVQMSASLVCLRLKSSHTQWCTCLGILGMYMVNPLVQKVVCNSAYKRDNCNVQHSSSVLCTSHVIWSSLTTSGYVSFVINVWFHPKVQPDYHLTLSIPKITMTHSECFNNHQPCQCIIHFASARRCACLEWLLRLQWLILAGTHLQIAADSSGWCIDRCVFL